MSKNQTELYNLFLALEQGLTSTMQTLTPEEKKIAITTIKNILSRI